MHPVHDPVVILFNKWFLVLLLLSFESLSCIQPGANVEWVGGGIGNGVSEPVDC